MAELPRDAMGRKISLDTKTLRSEDGEVLNVKSFEYDALSKQWQVNIMLDCGIDCWPPELFYIILKDARRLDKSALLTEEEREICQIKLRLRRTVKRMLSEGYVLAEIVNTMRENRDITLREIYSVIADLVMDDLENVGKPISSEEVRAARKKNAAKTPHQLNEVASL